MAEDNGEGVVSYELYNFSEEISDLRKLAIEKKLARACKLRAALTYQCSTLPNEE